MKKFRLLKKIILIIIIIQIIFVLDIFLNFSYGKSDLENNKISIVNDREPRIRLDLKDKNYYILFLHDYLGISLKKSSITIDGKDIPLTLIETTNTDKESTGVYNNKGERISDIEKKGKKYTGKRYDYGIKIKSSNLSSENYKTVTISTYDYSEKCYLNGTFKIRKLKEADKSGNYYSSNIAPRTTTKVINNEINLNMKDNTGIKSIKVYSNKTNELIFEYDVENDEKYSKSSKSSTNGFKENEIFYPYEINKPISLEKAKIDDNEYKIKVIAEDRLGVQSTKTIIVNVKNKTTYKIDAYYKAIQETAFGYYMRGDNIQYNTSKRAIDGVSPEQITTQNRDYMVCSAFAFQVFYEALGIKIPNSTNKLYMYTQDNIGQKEVFCYVKNEDKKIKITYYENGKSKGKKEIKSYAELIPNLKIGDIITYVSTIDKRGHTLIIYDLIKDQSGKITDAIVMESGGRTTYIRSKIGRTRNLGKKYGNIAIGNNMDTLYYYSAIGSLYGINEGTISVSMLSQKHDLNELIANDNNELFVLRLVQDDGKGNAVLNYNGVKFAGDKKYTNEFINLSDSIKDRIKYSHLYIEKTVDKGTNNTINEGSELTYKIIIKNKSKEDYLDDIVVKEKISKYVTYKDNSFKANKKKINISKDSDNIISFNIGKLKSGEEVDLYYTVKVNDNCNGKIIQSKGTVGNISSGVIKNKVGVCLTDSQKNKIVNSYNELKNKYKGKKLINEIYKKALNKDLKLSELDISNNSRLIKTDKSSREYSSIQLNSASRYYKYVLNNYYGALCELKVKNGSKTIKDSDGKKVKNYRQKLWKLHSDNNRRANTIYKEHFETGDILIYVNRNDVRYTVDNNKIKRNTVTYENGEYAYIYIEGQGFVGVNYGDDGKKNTKDDRNSFSEEYYRKNNLELFNDKKAHSNIREFANYQTLFGKDYYVILRPSLGM